MNFIKKLQQDTTELRAKLEAEKEKKQELTTYLLSKKFRCGDTLDGYVNTQDVLNRI